MPVRSDYRPEVPQSQAGGSQLFDGGALVLGASDGVTNASRLGDAGEADQGGTKEPCSTGQRNRGQVDPADEVVPVLIRATVVESEEHAAVAKASEPDAHVGSGLLRVGVAPDLGRDAVATGEAKVDRASP